MKLLGMAELLDVRNNFAWQPHHRAILPMPAGWTGLGFVFNSERWALTSVLTLCNDYASTFCAALGAKLPAKKANEQLRWLYTQDGIDEGWVKLGGEAEAVTLANAHELVLAIAQDVPHGHVGVLVESPDSDPTRPYVTAAGATNFVRCPLKQSFGALVPTFFHHKE